MNKDKHSSNNNKKKIYTVMQSRPAMQYWYYEVEAESEEEALDIVENDDIESVDYEIDYEIESTYGEDEYSVIEIKSK